MAETVKSTINLSKYYKEQLEYLVAIKELGSITEGINKAIEIFIKEKQKELYAESMKNASKDKDFLNRTMGCQKDFATSDNDLDKKIIPENEEW